MNNNQILANLDPNLGFFSTVEQINKLKNTGQITKDEHRIAIVDLKSAAISISLLNAKLLTELEGSNTINKDYLSHKFIEYNNLFEAIFPSGLEEGHYSY